jgi:hypothetical protein
MNNSGFSVSWIFPVAAAIPEERDYRAELARCSADADKSVPLEGSYAHGGAINPFFVFF